MSFEQPKTSERNPEINLTSDEKIILALRNKIKEYTDRSVASLDEVLDKNYKIFILEKLLNEGSVNFESVREKAIEEYDSIDEAIFDNAYGVIKDYNETGGKNNQGGTGLKTEKNSSDSSEKIDIVRNMIDNQEEVVIKSRSLGKNILGHAISFYGPELILVEYSDDNGESLSKTVRIDEFLEWQKENPLSNKK
jgi:hypothetical protein